MNSVDRPLLSVRSTADLISAVPYLLGFHPADSVVVVALRAKRVVFVARGDLPTPGAPAEQRDAAEYIAAVVRRQNAEAATVVGYGPAERVTPAVDAVRAAVERAGMRVLDALRVTEGRYWSYLCDNPECCPADGTPFDMASSEVAAAATFAGQVVLPDRAALTRQVAAIGGLTRESMRQATARAEERLGDLLEAAPEPDLLGGRALRQAGESAAREALDRHRQQGRLTDDEVAWFSLLLTHLPVRDYAWERTGVEDWHLALWTDVVRRAEPGLVAAPASLLAFAAWRAGQGALATVALERALADQPDYSLALLLEQTLRNGVQPSTLGGWPARGRRPAAGGGGNRKRGAKRSRPPGRRPHGRGTSRR
jgi:hypothetical protein